VGDVTMPLLCIIDVKVNTKRSRMHTIMTMPLFVPVHIKTNMGQLAPFADGSGKSHIVLEFKKSSLLNGLL